MKIANEAESRRCFIYPYEALEEAISNAVFHKSYDKQATIEIRIYEKFIEILERIGLTYHSSNLKKYIQPLIDDGVLISTSEALHSRSKKYISTIQI